MEQFVCKYCKKVCKNANALRNHERLCKSNPNHSINPMEGKSPWNKGLTKKTSITVLKMSEKLKKEFEPYNCKHCGKLVTIPYGSGVYCSKKCANTHVISDDQKKKISFGLISFWNKKGRKTNKETFKLPKSMLDLSKRTISKILKRANQGCMLCGWNEATCDIHHIIPKKNGGLDTNDNLIVICPNCHRKVHCNKLEIPKEKNIEVLFKNWTDYYYVDLKELKKLIDKNKR